MKYSAYPSMLFTLFLFTIAFGNPAQAAEQGDEFRLHVYGMFCNQCAYGLEQSLQHTDGVKDAIVDLRKNSAVVKVVSSGPPPAAALVQKAINQGISVKKIEATLTGRVEQTARGWELVAGSRRFSLTTDEGGPNIEDHVNQTVTLEGVFAGIKGVDKATGEPRFIARAIKG